MHEFTIATDGWKNQTVIVSDSVITILKSSGGKLIKQFKISDLVDITYIPVIYELGGRKLKSPHGLLRLATSWGEQRIGFFGEAEEDRFLGVYFNSKSENVAKELERYIRSLSGLQLPESPYLSQVSFLTFTLSLTKAELTVTHAPGYARIRHAIVGGFQPTDGEATAPVKDISAISFQPASSDKNHGGIFDGVLAFETPTTKLRPGLNGPFHVRFPKSMNHEIRKFCEILRSLQVSNQNSGDTPLTSNGSMSEEIKQLFELKEQGILSEDEFTSAKARLLG